MSFIKSITEKFNSKSVAKNENIVKIDTVLLRLFHDLRNNFIAIRAASGSIKNSLSHEQLNTSIEKSLSIINKMVDQSMVRLELSKIFSEKVQNHSFNITKFSMRTCINDAIDFYPFSSKNDILCVTKPNSRIDFFIDGNQHIFKNIFYCLIKNGLYAVNSHGSGKVVISLEKGQQHNLVVFEYPKNLNLSFQGDLFSLGLPEDPFPAYGLDFIQNSVATTGGKVLYEYKSGENIAVYMLFSLK